MIRQFMLVLGLVITITATSVAQAESWVDPITGMSFVSVPKGCFQMGSRVPVPPPSNVMWDRLNYTHSLSENEQPRHEVCVDAFWIGVFEVKRSEWRALMGNEPPGVGEADHDDYPVAYLSWDQAEQFANRLSERSGGKMRFRLPTEAEWEYACLAGQPQEADDPVQLEKVARFGLRSARLEARIGAVGQRQANALGLYDMLGNVWEWTGDAYQSNGYARHALYNPRVSAGDASAPRVIRGGSYRTEFEQVRCSKRGRQAPAEGLDNIGFRLVREY